ncbi:PTS cellobiose transporter subunit IIA [Jeotgalibaca ciconiae]|uniref:PTS cellobiose transporter subunit IIA n=1 Tax=Jeotgalibaca ciconiae TaxID=2496265 RepID=A0A3Q9BM61_9LACT|nr:PTS cellobiose transporter subunit IIA [Jeotgalibaca ciconiae]AZP05578.1 PTS cellobiose transporter subunit IIA [Jeotgalibaca ciconiae]HJB24647.1 PTS cellobiose transporter subunit IIA [Candidatus Jeotgalibaca pullicola]
MDKEQIQAVAFEIILHSGDARTVVHEAFKLMREGNEKTAIEKLEDANNKLTQAHKAQTQLLQSYAGGEEVNVDIIMVHAQDHLMTTMTLREVALEMLELYKRIN